MDNILWPFWKLFRHFSVILLLSCISNQAIANNHICDLNWIVKHPIEKCAILFEKKLSSLTQLETARFEKQFKELEANKVVTGYEDFAYFSNEYPKPEVLFSRLQLGEAVEKAVYQNNTVSADDIESMNFEIYHNTLAGYKIIVVMLENKHTLNENEVHILQTSKQRALCLDEILDYLANDPSIIIDTKVISDRCYQ